jgi:hypothetical protein
MVIVIRVVYGRCRIKQVQLIENGTLYAFDKVFPVSRTKRIRYCGSEVIGSH